MFSPMCVAVEGSTAEKGPSFANLICEDVVVPMICEGSVGLSALREFSEIAIEHFDMMSDDQNAEDML